MSGKNLEASISSLLYEHDCVIVPGFGGFIANYKPAHIHPRLKVICPPSKSITFNRQLLRNDGLIANYIAEKEHISYEAALAYIDSTVRQYNNELSAGKRLEIEKVGSLYLDSAQRLQFIPDQHTNFLSTSFGLSNMPLVELEKELEKTPVVPITEPIAVASSEEEGEKRTPWWIGAAAVALPLALLSVFSFQDVFKSNGSFEFANLNPFTQLKKQTEYASVEHESIALESSEESKISWDQAVNVNTESNSFSYDFNTGEASSDGVTIRVKAEAPEVVPTSNLRLYFVIAGAFEMEDNATGLVADLQKDGFDAAIVGKRGRLTLVAYGAYNSRRAAKTALRDIQSNNLSGWIYKK